MRLVLSSFFALGLFSSQAFAAPGQTPQPDIRDSGFVYCVSGQVDTFNPQKAGSGLIVDTLAAQLYDRLLDVDPYTYRLVPELAESWEVLDNGATYRFHLRDDVAPGLAMPHGRPEEGVKKTGFALVTLKTPLVFNHEDNDPVDILITMAAVDATTHQEVGIMQIVNLFDDEANFDRLRACRSEQEVLDLIKNATAAAV